MTEASLFHKPDNPYYLSHSVGCLPVSSDAFLAENFLTPWKMSGGDAWPKWLNTIEDFCTALSRLLGGHVLEYCPQTNLSSGFSKFLLSLPKDPRRQRIVMDANAFPSMGFVAKGLASLGFELLLIDPKADQTRLQCWEEHLDDRVLCALITHVHSNTGELSDVTAMTQLCSQFGIYSAVDIAQSVGVINIDVTQWQADAVFGSCVKWLCGGPGAGFMWVSSHCLAKLQPKDVGWFSHQNPFEWDIRHFEYADSALRFWGGTPSIAPYALALNGINTILQIGVERIYSHNRRLAAPVLTHFQSSLLRPICLAENGGTLCLALQHDALTRLTQQLKDDGCYFDVRGDTVRLSFHIYNDQQDVDKLIR